MDMIGRIRRLHARDKLSEREITRMTRLSIVSKWLCASVAETPKYRREARPNKLSAFETALKQALVVDARRPKYAPRIRQSEPSLALSCDEKSHRFSVGTAPVQKLFMTNMFKDYLRAPQEERDGLLTRHAISCVSTAGLPGAEADYDKDVQPRLVPIIRSRPNAYAVQTLDPTQYVEGLTVPISLPTIPGRVIGEDRAVHLLLIPST